jgi:hypothetical protein
MTDKFNEKMVLPKCDFCTHGGPVVWTIFTDARTIVIEDTKEKRSTTMNSDEEWAACEQCKLIVETGDHAALAQRSHDADPMPNEEADVEMLMQHQAVVLSNGEKMNVQKGMCFHSVLHEGLFWPGYQGKIEPVVPGERMVSRYVKIDMLDGDIMREVKVVIADLDDVLRRVRDVL